MFAGILLQKKITAFSRYLFSEKTFIIDIWQGPNDDSATNVKDTPDKFV